MLEPPAPGSQERHPKAPGLHQRGGRSRNQLPAIRSVKEIQVFVLVAKLPGQDLQAQERDSDKNDPDDDSTFY